MSQLPETGSPRLRQIIGDPQAAPQPPGKKKAVWWPGLPEVGFLRLPQILGDPDAVPPIPPIVPVKKSCWWAGVKSGRFPKPVKLGPRVTVWKVEDIRQLIASA